MGTDGASTENTRGIDFGDRPIGGSESNDFDRSIAVVIGIDDYANGIPRLSTAVNDARRLGAILRRYHGYEVRLLTRAITRNRLIRLLEEEIQVTSRDRLVFYFAGHGVALDGEDGPEGYLIPQDAQVDNRHSFLPMAALHGALEALDCRHMLAILDCCFAGTFRWSSGTRVIRRHREKIHNERYERYKKFPAWQVLTSAAHNQMALDVLSGQVIGRHGEETVSGSQRLHSPFAKALFDSLRGEAVRAPASGVLTATELYLDLRDSVQSKAKRHADHEQTPEIWPLSKHDKGEYVFLVPERDDHGDLIPGKKPDLPSAPNLTPEYNPYCGLDPYPPPGVEPEERDRGTLFFGRAKLTDELEKRVAEERLVIVLGASGSGKSSLVNAGLLRRLKEDAQWRALPPIRPGSAPEAGLIRHLRDELYEADASQPNGGGKTSREDSRGLISGWLKSHPQKRLLLVVDQFEEVLTQCRDVSQRTRYVKQLADLIDDRLKNLRIVLTLRLDFEPMVRDLWSKEGHWTEQCFFIVTQMNNDELREAIERPATERVLFFDPPSLVQDLIDAVQQTPAALPLISFTLSELYRRSDPDNRALTKKDYGALGGVIGSLRKRADAIYVDLIDTDHQSTMRRLMLRMVAFQGGEFSRRRLHESELIYGGGAEDVRVKDVLTQLTDARLIVSDTAENPWGETEPYWEPAHDALVVAWDQLRDWYADEVENLALQRRVTQAAGDWTRADDPAAKKGLLWDNDPHLPLARGLVAEESIATHEAEKGFPGKQFFVFRLLSGLRSAAANYWRSLFPDLEFPRGSFALNRLETEFVRESIRHRRDKLRVISTTVAGTMTLLATIAGIAWSQWQKAEEQVRIASAQRLSVGAEAALGRFPQRAGLLAVEAIKATKADSVMPVTEQALWNSLANIAGIGLGGHEAGIMSVAISPKGRWLVTGSDDSTARLWDLTAADPIHSARVLSGHNYPIMALAVDSREHWLVTVSWNRFGQGGPARLWDLTAADPTEGGRELRDPKHPITAVAIDPKGRWLVTGSWNSIPSGGPARLWDLTAADPTQSSRELRGHEYPITAVAIDLQGRWLVTGSSDTTARLWDLTAADPTQSARVLHGHKDRINVLAIDSQGHWLVTGSGDTTARLWDLTAADPTQSARELRGHEYPITAVAIDLQGHWLVTGSGDTTARLWDLTAADPTQSAHMLRGLGGPITAVAIGPNGRWLVTMSDNRSAQLWDLAAEDPTQSARVLRGHEAGIKSVAIGPQGRWLITAGDDITARLWDLTAEDPTQSARELRGHEDQINVVAIDPQGRWLVTGSGDTTARLWDLTSADPTESAPVLRGRLGGPITAVAIGPQGRWLATSDYNAARLWDLSAADPTQSARELRGHEGAIEALAIDPKGRWLVTLFDRGGSINAARLWDLSAADPTQSARVLRGHELETTAVAIGPKGRWLVTGSGDTTARLWDLSAADPTQSARVLRGHEGAIEALAIGPKGRWLVTLSEDGTARLWDLTVADPAQSARELRVHEGPITAVAIGPKRRWLVTGSRDAIVRWNLTAKDPTQSARVLRSHARDHERVEAVAIGPQGRWLVTLVTPGGHANAAWLWDLSAADPTQSARELHGHEGPITAVAIGPQGHWLVTGSYDTNARLWDLTAEDPTRSARVLRGHEDRIMSVAIGPKGRWLVTGSDDSTARLWDLQLPALIDHMRRAVGRNLTSAEWNQYFSLEPYCPTFPKLPIPADVKVSQACEPHE